MGLEQASHCPEPQRHRPESGFGCAFGAGERNAQLFQPLRRVCALRPSSLRELGRGAWAAALEEAACSPALGPRRLRGGGRWRRPEAVPVTRSPRAGGATPTRGPLQLPPLLKGVIAGPWAPARQSQDLGSRAPGHQLHRHGDTAAGRAGPGVSPLCGGPGARGRPRGWGGAAGGRVCSRKADVPGRPRVGEGEAAAGQ